MSDLMRKVEKRSGELRKKVIPVLDNIAITHLKIKNYRDRGEEVPQTLFDIQESNKELLNEICGLN